MLVKLAFVMQRLKKYQKKICHDQQRLGGGHRAHGGSPVPPLGKTMAIIFNEYPWYFS